MNPISTYRQFGQPASGSVVVNFVPTGASTVTIDGIVYTFGTSFTGINPPRVAESLAAAINADRGYQDVTNNKVAVKSVYAFPIGTTVAVIATVPGTSGNSITIATSDSTSFTVSGAVLAGGTNLAPAVSIGPSAATSVVCGTDVTIAVAGTAVQLPNLAASTEVVVSAHGDNVGDIYVGGSTVTKSTGVKRGITLAQYGMYTFKVSNANLLYINGDQAGDGVGVVVI